MFVKPNQFHIFAIYLLYKDSLFKGIIEALAIDKFANEIKVTLNNPSKEKNRVELSSNLRMNSSIKTIYYVPEGLC